VITRSPKGVLYALAMGILILPLTVVLAWVFAAFGLSAFGGDSSDQFAEQAMRWMLFLPAGLQFIVSGFMHTVFAKSTAEGIGWKTNGFQYELGFASWGLGIGGILAASRGWDTWLIMTVVASMFLVLAGVQHVVLMVRDKNFKPGNSLVLIYDFGLPASLIGLLIATHSSMA